MQKSLENCLPHSVKGWEGDLGSLSRPRWDNAACLKPPCSCTSSYRPDAEETQSICLQATDTGNSPPVFSESSSSYPLPRGQRNVFRVPSWLGGQQEASTAATTQRTNLFLFHLPTLPVHIAAWLGAGTGPTSCSWADRVALASGAVALLLPFSPLQNLLCQQRARSGNFHLPLALP